MKTSMKIVLFTDESRASPNDPDGWTKEWVFKGDIIVLWEYGVNKVVEWL